MIEFQFCGELLFCPKLMLKQTECFDGLIGGRKMTKTEKNTFSCWRTVSSSAVILLPRA